MLPRLVCPLTETIAIRKATNLSEHSDFINQALQMQLTQQQNELQQLKNEIAMIKNEVTALCKN